MDTYDFQLLDHHHFYTHVHVFQNALDKDILLALSQNRQGRHVNIVDTANAKFRFAINEASEDDLNDAKKLG